MSLENLAVIIPQRTFELFGIPGWDISWYGLIISIAIIAAVVLCLFLCKLRGIKSDDVIDIGFVVVPLGIVGARIIHVLSKWDYYFNPSSRLDWDWWDVFAIWEGGITILGAIIFGALGVVIISKIKKLNMFKIADFIVPSVALAQAIGRWGNFFNQELYGPIVNHDVFPFSVFIEATGNFHMGLFFYESLLNLVNFAICLILLKLVKKEGLVAAVFVLFYGISRVILEGLRYGDSHVVGWLGLHVWQWFAIGFIAAGIAGVLVWIWYHYRRVPKEAKKDVK